MRWVVHARAELDATHALASYCGQAEPSHSHHWTVEVRVGTDRLSQEGYALDFHAVSELLTAAVAPLDGADLNRHPTIGEPSPTAERLAEVLASTLAPRFLALGGRLLTVSVWEGADNRVDLNLD